MLGPNVAEARNATVLGLNDVDKQKLEEARQLAMSMISHPLAFGTIEHTEKAGELLAELAKWREPLTEDQRMQLFLEMCAPCVEADSPFTMFTLIVQAVERAHGIGA